MKRAGILAVLMVAFVAGTAQARSPSPYGRCADLNSVCPHGVGKLGARDHVAPENEPVTTFRRSTRVYTLATKYNRGLDRDHDGVACEKL